MSFDVLMIILNNIIRSLNEYGFEIKDEENPDYFISEIYYDEKSDSLFFKCK